MPFAAFLAIACSACVDTSTDRVLLDARVESVELELQESALVTALRGNFTLVLELGDLATNESTVEAAPGFSLVTAETQESIVGLDALLDDATLPVTVRPGATERLRLVLTDENLLDASEVDTACGASLQVAGSIRDAANDDRPLAFSSAPFSLEECP